MVDVAQDDGRTGANFLNLVAEFAVVCPLVRGYSESGNQLSGRRSANPYQLFDGFIPSVGVDLVGGQDLDLILDHLLGGAAVQETETDGGHQDGTRQVSFHGRSLFEGGQDARKLAIYKEIGANGP